MSIFYSDSQIPKIATAWGSGGTVIRWRSQCSPYWLYDENDFIKNEPQYYSFCMMYRAQVTNTDSGQKEWSGTASSRYSRSQFGGGENPSACSVKPAIGAPLGHHLHELSGAASGATLRLVSSEELYWYTFNASTVRCHCRYVQANCWFLWLLRLP